MPSSCNMSCARRIFLFGMIVAICCSAAPATFAEDYFLTIGGGYSPTGNQISLEKNILFFQKVLAEVEPNAARHDIYFADGDAAGRDLQFAKVDEVPEANRLMAHILGNTNDIELVYRNHDIPGVKGMSSVESIDRWIAENGERMKKGDRLFLYATAHGGKSADNRNSGNTKLYLWNNASLQVSELMNKFEKLPKDIPIVLVMVQCYSGGFANAIFENADMKKDVRDRDVCGFFSTVETRKAAGCTPDIDEDNYEEYSTYFWSAILGKTRLGKNVEKPDYNQDGFVSFDEAHAYVLLHSNTIDIPIKTSDAFLRKYTGTSANGNREKRQQRREERKLDLLAPESPYDDLISVASETDAIVLEGLSKELNLTKPERYEEAKALAKQIQDNRTRLSREIGRENKVLSGLRRGMATRLKAHWPELANTFSKTATELLTTRSNEFVDRVKSDKDYSQYISLVKKIDAMDSNRLDLERRWAKCQRVMRELENVAYAYNLPLLEDIDVIARYERLRALERSSMSRAGE